MNQPLKCPQCGSRMIVLTLTSNPPQYEAHCSRNDFYLPYYVRKDRYAKVTQEELQARVDEWKDGY